MLTSTLFLLPFLCISMVRSGSVNKGGACSTDNNRLQIGTYQFVGDCDTHTFCNSSSLCSLKKCRRDIFPFGYAQDDDHLPPLCKQGTFCPDEEDACQPLLAVGSACQLNRDDQCEAPPNFQELADTTGFALNHNGSVCLNFQCMWANATLGQTCVVENTNYIAYGADGKEFPDIVSRYERYCISSTCFSHTFSNIVEIVRPTYIAILRHYYA